MKKLVYKIHKVDENGKQELIFKGTEKEAMKRFKVINPEKEFIFQLSAQWELNGRNLGTTLITEK
jgi:hypothetical protein